MFTNRAMKSKYEDKEGEDDNEAKNLMSSNMYYKEKIVKDDKETRDQTKDIMSKFKNAKLENLGHQTNIT